jgi:ribonucleotide monophosphatase NagD (HAD superfamily)
VLGRDIKRHEVLAIGDGLPTDVQGARANGYPVHFITGGIHAADHDGTELSDIAAGLEANMPGLKVAGVAPALEW